MMLRICVVSLSFVVGHMHGVQTKGRAASYIQNHPLHPHGGRNRWGKVQIQLALRISQEREWSHFWCLCTIMHFAPQAFYALRFAPCALRLALCALRFAPCALRLALCALRFAPFAPCAFAPCAFTLARLAVSWREHQVRINLHTIFPDQQP